LVKQQLQTLSQLRSLSSTVLKSSKQKQELPVMKSKITCDSSSSSISLPVPAIRVHNGGSERVTTKPNMTDLIAQSRSIQLRKASESIHPSQQTVKQGSTVAESSTSGGGDLAKYMKVALDKRFQSLRKKKPIDSPNSDGGVFSDDNDTVSMPLFSPPVSKASVSTVSTSGGVAIQKANL
jgi:hypothetical protein